MGKTWMDKVDVVHIFIGIPLSHQKEGNYAICSNMDATWDYHTKWSKSDIERQISHDVTYTWNLKKWYKGTYLQNRNRTVLVVQWLGICLPMQGTWVRSLAWEDSTCPRASTETTTTEAQALWSPWSATREATAMRSPHTTTREKAPLMATRRKPSRSNEDPLQPKINKYLKIILKKSMTSVLIKKELGWGEIWTQREEKAMWRWRQSLGWCSHKPRPAGSQQMLKEERTLSQSSGKQCGGVPSGSAGKGSTCSAGDKGDTSSIPGLGRSPGEGNGSHSSILAWRVPWMEEPGGLPSMGLHVALEVPCFQTSGLQSRARISFYCFKPPSLR